MGADLLSQDLADKDKEFGIRRNNRDLILNQFMIGLIKDVMREIGIQLLRKDSLDLDKSRRIG